MIACANVLSFLAFEYLLVGAQEAPKAVDNKAKGDDKTFTLDLGPITEYHKTSAGIETPTGTSLQIYPTDANSIPSDGLYLVMGDTIQKSLSDASKKDCAKVDESRCLNSLGRVFEKHDSDIARRAEMSWLSVFRGAGQIALVFEKCVSYLLAKWDFDNGGSRDMPGNLHFPPKVLSQMTGASSASVVVLQTTAQDASAVTATVSPATAVSSTPTDGPLIKLTKDEDGHSKGDVEIIVPSDAAEKALNEYFKKGKCLGPRSANVDGELDKRAPSTVECLLNNAQNILEAMGASGPLNALAQPAMQVAQNFPLPGFINTDFAAAFGQWVVTASEALPRQFENIAELQITPTTVFVFLLAIQEYRNQYVRGRSLWLAAKEFTSKAAKIECPKKGDTFFPSCEAKICRGKDGKCTTDIMRSCACGGEKAKCPKDATKADCDKCEGGTGKCTKGDQQGCRCVYQPMVNIHYEDPVGWQKTLYDLWRQVGEYDVKDSVPEVKGDPKCEKPDSEFGDIPATMLGDYTYTPFCDTIEDSGFKAHKETVTPDGQAVKKSGDGRRFKARARVVPEQLSGYEITLEWTGGNGKCPSDCKKAFDKFRKGCQITPTPGGVVIPGGGVNIKPSGKLDTGCGTYSYSIMSTKPKVPQAGKRMCKPNEARFEKCWNPIDGKIVEETAKAMSGKVKGVFKSDQGNTSQVLRKDGDGGRGGKGVTYFMNIGWIPGCEEYESMNDNYPQTLGATGEDGPYYTEILKDLYHKCGNNDGLGGYQDYGCLRYGFYPNNIKGVYGTSPDYSKYWDANGDICG